MFAKRKWRWCANADARPGPSCTNTLSSPTLPLAVPHSKFAFVVADPDGSSSIYAFQFRHKADINPFLDALEKATAVVAEGEHGKDTGGEGATSQRKRKKQNVSIKQRSNDSLVCK